MYSVRRDPNHSYYYWTINCSQQQHFLFHNRQMIKSKQSYSWSTKSSQKDNSSWNNNSIKSADQDVVLPVYRAPCTFQMTTSKDGYASGICRRSPLLSTSSSCVPDVYSPGPTSSGNCSPPPPSSNLPPPPSEWLD